MTHSPDETLLANIEDFLARTGMSQSRFGEMACSDRNFVTQLREGQREFKPSTIGKVEKWMAGFDAGAAFVQHSEPQQLDGAR